MRKPTPAFWDDIDQALADVTDLDPMMARSMIAELLFDYRGQAAAVEADAEVNPDRREKLRRILKIAGLLQDAPP
jgi:hypothetical protein